MPKSAYTTTDIARICSVAPRTVAKWIDTGMLQGYRVPGTTHRRVPTETLHQFLKDHGMSMLIPKEEA